MPFACKAEAVDSSSEISFRVKGVAKREKYFETCAVHKQ